MSQSAKIRSEYRPDFSIDDGTITIWRGYFDPAGLHQRSDDALIRMQQPDGVRPACGDELGMSCANFRPKLGIVSPALWLVDIEIGWDDVEVADQSHMHSENNSAA